MLAGVTVIYWQVALALLIIFINYVVIKGWHSRRLFYKLRRQGLVSRDLYLFLCLRFLTPGSPYLLGTLSLAICSPSSLF